MRWGVAAQRNLLLVLAISGLALLPARFGTAVGLQSCPDSAAPELAPSLVDLQQALGDAMGSPASCAELDARGDIVQVMTTGLAVARSDGTAVFASGEHHWALTSEGLQSWVGNWHNGLYPPATPQPSPPAQAATDEVELAKIEAMTVVGLPENTSNVVVLQDPDGTLFRVQTATGCPDLAAMLGNHVFLRTSQSHTELIIVQQQATCSVADMHSPDGG